MGQTCTSDCCFYIQQCKDSTYQLAFEKDALEEFQDRKIETAKLGSYDRFYRIVTDPLFTIPVEKFISDLDNLVCKVEEEEGQSGEGMQ